MRHGCTRRSDPSPPPEAMGYPLSARPFGGTVDVIEPLRDLTFSARRRVHHPRPAPRAHTGETPAPPGEERARCPCPPIASGGRDARSPLGRAWSPERLTLAVGDAYTKGDVAEGVSMSRPTEPQGGRGGVLRRVLLYVLLFSERRRCLGDP